MIERRQIDHIDLVQLGKTLLLLFKRQELLVDLPDMTHRTEEVVQIVPRTACKFGIGRSPVACNGSSPLRRYRDTRTDFRSWVWLWA
jgi:hypothetical protein